MQFSIKKEINYPVKLTDLTSDLAEVMEAVTKAGGNPGDAVVSINTTASPRANADGQRGTLRVTW